MSDTSTGSTHTTASVLVHALCLGTILLTAWTVFCLTASCPIIASIILAVIVAIIIFKVIDDHSYYYPVIGAGARGDIPRYWGEKLRPKRPDYISGEIVAIAGLILIVAGFAFPLWGGIVVAFNIVYAIPYASAIRCP